VLLDARSHACLQQGARAATAHVHRHRHLDVAHAIEKLAAIRGTSPTCGVLVVTEGLFSMDADVPHLAPLQEACAAFGARLLVDVAHDLGAMGPGGTGMLGAQGLLGRVDLVMGSFSKTFASNGGFVASNDRTIADYLTYFAGPHTFSNALSPIQAAVVGTCLDIVQSAEGDTRRELVAAAAQALRDALRARRLCCLGIPSPIVPVVVGTSVIARRASRIIAARGLLANLVEYPAVSRSESRFRLQVMAAHTSVQAAEAARILEEAVQEASVEREADQPDVETAPVLSRAR
jgi:glycine C-acetyltransferase/8-amino-7-oxononanoate synthase